MSSAKSPFDAADAERVSRERFGIDVRATPLAGYGDRNFRLDGAAGPIGTLKLALETPARPLLEAQDAALAHLTDRGLQVPRAQPGRDGQTLQAVRLPSQRTAFARLISWVPGRPLGTLGSVPLELERAVGAFLAHVAHHLASFEVASIDRRWAWNLARAELARDALPAVEDVSLRTLLGRHLDHFEHEIAPRLRALPRAWIHGDGNAWNVLVEGDEPDVRISGLIDFGDLVHTPRVCDAAIAAGYALLRHDDTSGARALLDGYESVLPLQAAERALLPELARTRLVVSAAKSAAARARDPGNAYLSADAGPATAWLMAAGDAPPSGLWH